MSLKSAWRLWQGPFMRGVLFRPLHVGFNLGSAGSLTKGATVVGRQVCAAHCSAGSLVHAPPAKAGALSRTDCRSRWGWNAVREVPGCLICMCSAF